MTRNGSSRATIETDDNRTYFLIDIPCRVGAEFDYLSQGIDELNQGVNTIHKSRIKNRKDKENFINEIILFCKEPISLNEIAIMFGAKDKYHFKKVYINPILGNFLFMTEPDSPKSPSQKYTSTKP